MYKIKNLKYKGILKIDELNILENNINVISGRSGLGKTTLLSLLSGKDYDYVGEIYLYNTLLKYIDTKDVMKHVSYLEQKSVLLGNKVEDEFKIISKLLDKEYDEEEVKQILKVACLDYNPEDYSGKFSGGEQQRLFIARTLYTDSKVIILDEPTSALDSEVTKELINNLHEYIKERGKSIILVSHDTELINDQRFINIDLGDYNGHN